MSQWSTFPSTHEAWLSCHLEGSNCQYGWSTPKFHGWSSWWQLRLFHTRWQPYLGPQDLLASSDAKQLNGSTLPWRQEWSIGCSWLSKQMVQGWCCNVQLAKTANGMMCFWLLTRKGIMLAKCLCGIWSYLCIISISFIYGLLYPNVWYMEDTIQGETKHMGNHK